MVQQVPPSKRPPRHDEWTRPKMVAFLRELAATQSVSAAAKGVGMSRQSAFDGLGQAPSLRPPFAGAPSAMVRPGAGGTLRPSGALFSRVGLTFA